MTVDQFQGGGDNLPANAEDFGATGLEDFDLTDAIIPRIQIKHADGLWKDNLSGQTFEKLRMVILGLTKQRILFHHQVDDGDMPMCKSPDFTTGYPNLEQGGKKAFPWQKAGFDPNQIPLTPTGQKPLPCGSCALKEWGSHPTGDNPYCAEQWTLSIMYDPNNDGTWVPAFLSLQKSSIKPIRSYLTSFARTKRAAFTAVCEATLKVSSRGSVDYSVPTFVNAGESDRSQWAKWSEDFLSMRSYLTQAPVARDEDGNAPAPAPQNNVNTAPQQAADPWAAQQQSAPPQTQPEPQPAPQQPAPEPTPAPEPQQTPPPAPPQPSTPPAPAPTPAPQAAADDDDLPF